MNPASTTASVSYILLFLLMAPPAVSHAELVAAVLLPGLLLHVTFRHSIASAEKVGDPFAEPSVGFFPSRTSLRRCSKHIPKVVSTIQL